MPYLIPTGRANELLPVRRLSPDDCEKLGYEGPLILSVRQVRFLFGRRHQLDDYAAVHHARGVMWCGSRSELERLGVDPAETPQTRPPRPPPAP